MILSAKLIYYDGLSVMVDGLSCNFKGYLDRVLSHGFAYKTENGESKGLIQGKVMQQFITIGSSVAQNIKNTV